MLAWKGREFGVIRGDGKKSSRWVNFGCILKDGEEKEKDKKICLTHIQTGKTGFHFSSILQDVFNCQAVPAAVTALQCCFMHIWFVHAAIQGVTVAKAHVSLSPWDYTQFWVWWLLNTAMGAMDTQIYIHRPQGGYIPGTRLAEAQSHADLPIPAPLRILLVLSEAQYACAAYHT